MINLCVMGCPPAPVYKGARGVELPFPSPTRKEEGGRKERERERERGAAPPSPSPIRTPHGRGRATSWAAALSLPSGPLRPNTSPGGSGNPSGTLVFSEITRITSVSEYSRPIYRSLCLDHFETPRHVRDHIRDTEQPSVHQNTKTLITIVTEL